MVDLRFGAYHATEYVGVRGRIDAYKGQDATGAAVLVMTAPVSSDQEEDWFATRAQKAASLANSRVAKVLQWGREGNLFFVVEEWIEGRPVASAVEAGPLDPVSAARVGAQVCEVLEAAHENGLVDGDVRPSELIFVGPSNDDVHVAGLGAPAVADAFMMPSGAPPEAAYYLSPEQAGGGPATPSSDIYALGATLYHLVTGRVPFEAPSGSDVARLHAEETLVPPRSVNPDVPAALERVILRAMEKDPARRYGSAQQMRHDLERAAAGPADTTRMEPVHAAAPAAAAVSVRRRAPLWPWFVGAAIVLALLAAWAMGLFSRGDTVVPDVVGIEIEAAVLAIEDAGLAVGRVTYDANFDEDRFADGEVTAQDPAAGAVVDSGDPVNLTVAGSEVAEVPDVVGLSEGEAIEAIQEAGFILGDVRREFSDEVEADVVITQAPRAGDEAPKGSQVSIVISRGVETLTVPNVVGLTRGEATEQFRSADLGVRVVEEYSDSVPAEQVIAQSPEAGVAVESGTMITITVSLGEETITMPNVVGMEEDAAIAMLEDLGLVVTVETQTNVINAGRVIAQEPESGTVLEPGSGVTVTVATES